MKSICFVQLMQQVAVRTYEGQLSDEDLAQMESIVEEMKILVRMI